jgi:phospholipid/cholesterol/gamma-HCH transport system ATP-binding protein
MPAELSGGMARRVALARAIALDPMLIMYDEPFAGLDPISLGIIGQLIRRLNDALGATTIMVTHDIQESLLIVDYIYFMSDGQGGRPRHAGRDPCFAAILLSISSSLPRPTDRYPSIIRRLPLAEELLGRGRRMSGR